MGKKRKNSQNMTFLGTTSTWYTTERYSNILKGLLYTRVGRAAASILNTNIPHGHTVC